MSNKPAVDPFPTPPVAKPTKTVGDAVKLQVVSTDACLIFLLNFVLHGHGPDTAEQATALLETFPKAPEKPLDEDTPIETPTHKTDK